MILQTTAAVIAACAIIIFAAPALFFATGTQVPATRRIGLVLGTTCVALTLGFLMGVLAGGNHLADLPAFAQILLYVAIPCGLAGGLMSLHAAR